MISAATRPSIIDASSQHPSFAVGGLVVPVTSSVYRSSAANSSSATI
jgi:hypothetical protein